MKRVVLDSDDEDEPIESLAANDEASREEDTNLDGGQNLPEASEQLKPRGTSSSDKLKLDLNQAYSAMIEYTPASRLASESPSRPRLKRRRSIDSFGLETPENEENHQTRRSKMLRKHSSRDRNGRNEDTSITDVHSTTCLQKGAVHQISPSPENGRAIIKGDWPGMSHYSTRANSHLGDAAVAVQTIDGDDVDDPAKTIDSPTAHGDPNAIDDEEAPTTAIQDSEITVVVPKISHQPILNDDAAHKKQSRNAGGRNDSHDLSDDELCGMPKEGYKPRPSRSRSHGLLVESTDTPFGVGGKSRKAKSKRRASTDADTVGNGEKLREMGLKSSQVDRTILEAGGSLELAIETLSSTQARLCEDGEDSNEQNAAKKKNKSRKKSNHETLDDDVGVEPKNNASTTKAQDAQALIAPVDTVEPKDSTLNVKSTKRGRGRPKKIQVESTDLDPPPDGKGHVEESHSTALQEADVNKVIIERKGKCTTPSKQDVSNQREAEDMVKTKTASPSKPHSPLNKDKVPFKLGLSRRARIEPLLRFIKK